MQRRSKGMSVKGETGDLRPDNGTLADCAPVGGRGGGL